MAEARVVRDADGPVADSGGIPWVFKAGGGAGAAFDFMVGRIPYLSGPPLHVHREQEDTFYVLDGVLAVQVRDEVFDLGPGDFATVPRGIPHTFDNVRDGEPPVRAVNLMTPGGLDSFLAELGTLDADPEPGAVEQIGAKHGVMFVGPPLRVRLGLSTT